jgi:hypothetical protein
VSGELQKAVARFEERKMAMNVFAEEDIAAITDDEGARMMFSGLDLDFEEISALRMTMVEAALDGLRQDAERGVETGSSLAAALAGLFIEGLVVGMLTEKGRHDG